MNETFNYKTRLRTYLLSPADGALLSMLVAFVSLTPQTADAANLFGNPAGDWQQYFLTPDVATQAAFWVYIEPGGNRIFSILPNPYLTQNEPPTSAAYEVYTDPRIQYDGYYFNSSLTNTGSAWWVAMGNDAVGNANYLASDDLFGGIAEDVLYAAQGDDYLDAGDSNDTLVGGSGNDLLYGRDGNDALYGDWAQQPENLESYPNWTFPSEDTSLTGDDYLDGGDGADTLLGGPGADQLSGGPRGQGWLDILTGGPGADAFLLSYSTSSPGSTASTFWTKFADSYAGDIAGNAVKGGIDKLTKTAANAFYNSVTGGILLGGMETALGGAIAEGIDFLLGMSKPATPKPDTPDLMSVTDFDPREDTLFLPLPSDGYTVLTASPTYFAASGTGSASGQEGWGIQFTDGTANTIYAEVFLDTDFLNAFGLDSSGNSAAIIGLINNVLATRLTITSSGYTQADAYQFPTDTSSYSDGQLPTVADAPVDFAVPDGTSMAVFGAFGPLSFINPSTSTSAIYLAGTNLGDILNINSGPFAPEDAITSGQLTSATSHVMAFGGDDIVFAGDGIDNIHLGDGDDVVFGIGHEGVETVEYFYGDDGNDVIYLGWTSMQAVADGGSGPDNCPGGTDNGGDGTDKVSFLYTFDSDVWVDLTKTGCVDQETGITQDTANANSTNTDNVTSLYALQSIENIDGSPGDDTITGDQNVNYLFGDDGDDTIQGNGGSYSDDFGTYFDTIAGGAGADVLQNDVNDWNNVTTYVDASDTLIIQNETTPAEYLLLGKDEWVLGWNDYDIEILLYTTDGSKFPDFNQQIIDGDLYITGPDITVVGGTSSRDSLTGSAGNDLLFGGKGRDILDGRAGNDRLIGGAGRDVLIGGEGKDTLIGGAEADILTGGEGIDRFQFPSLSDSLLHKYDRITDLHIGEDRIDGPNPVSAKELAQLPEVSALKAKAIKNVLTTSTFLAKGAATFTVGSRTYLALNDDVAGFQATSDAIIEITGYTGDLTALRIF